MIAAAALTAAIKRRLHQLTTDGRALRNYRRPIVTGRRHHQTLSSSLSSSSATASRPALHLIYLVEWRQLHLRSRVFTAQRYTRKRGLCCRQLYVRPSVTLVYCIHMTEDVVKILSHLSSRIILVFEPRCRYQIPRGTPSAGRKIHGGGKILRFSTEIAVYLGNGTR